MKEDEPRLNGTHPLRFRSLLRYQLDMCTWPGFVAFGKIGARLTGRGDIVGSGSL